MKLSAVSMVKDESDIIIYTIENLFNQGVDEIIVADNMSSDGTLELLLDYAQTTSQLSVVSDNEVAYYQSQKMTGLANSAFDKGADIVIPFDADEYWTGVCQTLREAIELADHAKVYHFQLVNYFPSKDDVLDPSPFKTITNRCAEASQLGKVAIRSGMTIMQGNHNAEGNGTHTEVSGAMIGHFSWRSQEQFRRKVSNGYKAYQATDLPDGMGAHWRAYGKVLHEEGPDALDVIFDTWFKDPELETFEYPVTELQWAD